MATFHITSATSVSTTAAGDHAFQNNTANSDTLIVDEDAYLIATGASAAGALLGAPGLWKVTVNGSIFSQQYVGLRTNAPISLTVGVNGEIGGGTIGVEFFGSATTIKNSGVIAGSQWAIQDTTGGNTVINNLGLLDGDVQLNAVTTTLTNAGRIAGLVAGGAGNETISNSGTIAESVDFGNGTNKLTNSGMIGSGVGTAVSAGAGDDAFVNSGIIDGTVATGFGNNVVQNTKTITGSVFMAGPAGTTNNLVNAGIIGGVVAFGGGTNSLTNSGTIESGINFASAVSVTTIKNTGTIRGSIIGDEGSPTITNSGTIDGFILLDQGIDRITNSGTITGTVSLGRDNDVFTDFRMVNGVVKNGTVLGIIDMGQGDDSFTGGANAETLQDNEGSDTANFGGGADVYLAAHAGTDGSDSLNGGTGLDTYDASGGGSVFINLDTAAHDLSGTFAGAAAVAANTATGDSVTIPGLKDSIVAFENAIGGGGNDVIYGSAAANVLNGGEFDDSLFGFAGNDVLVGEAGNDFLAGGAGKDMLTGGVTGTDTFAFLAISDSGTAAATRDVITDFDDGADKISLSGIDANTTNGAGDDAFNFIGTNTAFTNVAGQLRAYFTPTGQIIEGDVNGDGKADFSIKLTDPTHAIALDSSDFLL